MVFLDSCPQLPQTMIVSDFDSFKISPQFSHLIVQYGTSLQHLVLVMHLFFDPKQVKYKKQGVASKPGYDISLGLVWPKPSLTLIMSTKTKEKL